MSLHFPQRFPSPPALRLLFPILLLTALLFGAGCTSIDRANLTESPPPTPPTSEVAAPAPAAPVEAPAAEASDQSAAKFDPTTAALDTVIPVAPEVLTGQLDNGLRYYVRENGRPQKRAELRLVINAGSILEDEDQLGLAHFVEHMAFNGTEHFEKHELVDYLQSIGMRFGADVNAYTSFDETVYMLTVPTDDEEILDKAFLVLAEWAGRVKFEDEEIEKERGVVVEEWRRSQGAGMRISDRQLPVVYHGSRYPDRLPIGTKESVETAPGDALRRFYEDWYRPSLMAVSVAGDLDAEKARALIEKHLGSLEARENPRERTVYPVPGHPEPLFSIETDPELTTTVVTVLFKRPAEQQGTVGDYRRGLVEGLHAFMLNSRLREIAESADPPFVFGSASGNSLSRTASIYQLDARVFEGQVEKGLGSLLVEMERVDRHGFGQGELERAKKELLRGYEQLAREADTQESAGFASEYTRAFLEGEPVPGIEAEVAMARRFLPEITLEEVNALGSRFITDENRVILVNGPEKAKGTLPDEEGLLAIFDRSAKAEVEPWVDRTKDQPLMAEKPEPGKVVKESHHEGLDLTIWELSNGIRVAMRPTDFLNDQVMFSAWSPGGSSLVADEDFDSANFATFILGQSGLGDFDVIELQKALAGKLAGAGPYIRELEEGLSGGGSPEDLETVMQLIHLNFTAPRLDPAAFENILGRMTAMVENRTKNPNVVFRDEFTRRISMDHRRRQPVSVESLQRIDPQRALAIYQERFADASDFTFIFVGNFEVEAMRPLVETYLASLPNLDRGETWRDVGVKRPGGAVRFEVQKGLEPKAGINLLFYGEADWVRERRFQMIGLTRVLEISLTELIREEMGAAYSVSVGGSLDRYPEEVFDLTVAFSCDPEQVDTIVDALLGELKKVRESGPDPDTVAKVRENLLRQRETQLRENTFWLSALETYLKHDLDLDLLLRYEELAATLTPELVQDAARRFTDPEQYLLGILKPEEGATSEGVGARSDGEASGEE